MLLYIYFETAFCPIHPHSFIKLSVANVLTFQKLITQYRAAIIHHRKQPVRVVTPAPLPKPPTPQAIPPPPQPQQQQVHYHDPAMEPLRYENVSMHEYPNPHVI